MAAIGRSNVGDLPLDAVGDGGKVALRRPAEQIDDPRIGCGNAAGLRQQFEHRHFQRVGDGPHHQHGRIAGAAFDLRQIALRRSGFLCELAARHAALGAAKPHHAADLAREGRIGAAGKVGGFACIEGVRHTCTIIHV